jgi:hypothetical protein
MTNSRREWQKWTSSEKQREEREVIDGRLQKESTILEVVYIDPTYPILLQCDISRANGWRYGDTDQVIGFRKST